MGDVPLDARRIVDELRSSRRASTLSAPEVWVPSEAFEATATQLNRKPVQVSPNLEWLHRNWNLRDLLAPPPGNGLRGIVRRAVHRLVMSALKPYFDRLQDYLMANLRAVDTVAHRTDENATDMLRMLGAIRSDLVDFAHHVDERLSD
jgi:hypothetical protein